jgi:hypothetical protein
MEQSVLFVLLTIVVLFMSVFWFVLLLAVPNELDQRLAELANRSARRISEALSIVGRVCSVLHAVVAVCLGTDDVSM